MGRDEYSSRKDYHRSSRSRHTRSRSRSRSVSTDRRRSRDLSRERSRKRSRHRRRSYSGERDGRSRKGSRRDYSPSRSRSRSRERRRRRHRSARDESDRKGSRRRDRRSSPSEDDEAHGPQPPPPNSKLSLQEQPSEVVKPAEVNGSQQESEKNQKQDAIGDRQAVPTAEIIAKDTIKVDNPTEMDGSSKPPEFRPGMTKVKQKRAKPIRGFFGGDEDDDDAGVQEQLQKNKKKFVGLSDAEDEEAEVASEISKARETAVAISPSPANGAKTDEIMVDSTEQAGDDEDTLDAFMNNIEEQVQMTHSREEAEGTGRLLSDDDDAGGIRKAASDEEEDFVVEEEEEEESWLTKLRKKRPTYEKINHATMNYEEVKKAFYIESAELTRMTDEQVSTRAMNHLDLKTAQSLTRARSLLGPLQFAGCALSEGVGWDQDTRKAMS